MQDIYQFIKYDKGTSPESIIKKSESGAVICFDLEDSIFNWIDATQGNEIKSGYRKILHSILNKLNEGDAPINIGIRLNPSESGQQQLDLDAIPAKSTIHTLIIPKVENPTDIDRLVDDLYARNIAVDEIIPIIESRKGLQNLKNILLSKYPVTKVGFGHCDYNLSVGAFPFFHQDSNEYWKWVNHIVAILNPRKIKFINSAYLNLGNLAFFRSMLSHLHGICDGNFGQFTLTYQQTLQCGQFVNETHPKGRISSNRLNLGIGKLETELLISTFENSNTGKGFSVMPETKTLISPQEYLSAKRLLRNWKGETIHFTFVGGCFPVQADILYEDIFHQTLKRSIETNLGINFNINIIRYEKLGNCLEKIAGYYNENQVDCLVFHIRPEPFLRITKLYYKYLDAGFEQRRSFNLPLINVLNPEKYDLLRLSQRYNPAANAKTSKLHKALINLNYMAGYCIGNQNYALKSYLALVHDVVGYCNKQGIKLLLLGPAKRKGTYMEAIFTQRLEKYMDKNLKSGTAKYIDGTETKTQVGEKYFNENGIHATKSYHDLIAKRLYESIETIFGF